MKTQTCASGALTLLLTSVLFGCSDEGSTGKPLAVPTYYADIKPLMEVKCSNCHVEGGIGPFAMTTPEQVIALKDTIVDAVETRRMPPWPPSMKSTELAHNRSLSDAQIDTISRWVAAGTPLGDPAAYVPPTDKPSTLSRIDMEVAIPEPYKPTQSPDEYRCFVLDWPHSTTKYMTGMGVKPGEASIVHHVVLFYARPDAVPTYEAFDAADPGPGYQCFGGPRGDDPNVQGPAGYRILGGWAPGTFGNDMPVGTGIEVPPGAKLILQMHYNLAHGVSAPDQTKVVLRLDDKVDFPAYSMPWLDPEWVKSGTMTIPAGESDVLHEYQNDAVFGASLFTKGAITTDKPMTIYGLGLHQHLRGKSISMSLDRSDGQSQVLVDIPRWDYHWQAPYTFAKPLTVASGDRLHLTCHFDNSAENQPLSGGVKMPPKELNWGEGTDDEMCLGWLYITQQ